MLLPISYAGFFISFLLLLFLNKTNRANIYLFLFFLINSIYGIAHYVVIYSKSPFWVTIMFIHFVPIFVLSGPMLFFYFRTTLQRGRARLKGYDLLHFVPALLFFINIFTHLISPFEYKMELAQKVIDDPMNVFLLNFPYIPVQISFLFRPFHGVFYIVLCGAYYFIHLRKNQEQLCPEFKIKWNENWHFMFLLISFVMYLFFLVLSFVVVIYGEGAKKINNDTYISEIMLLFFLVSNLSIMLFPKELYGLPIFGKHLEKLGNQQTLVENDLQLNIKTNVFFLVPKRLKEISVIIKGYLVENPCIRSGFNLNQMSIDIHIPKHQLTYYFNDHLKITFNEWKNEIRINHAVELFKQGNAVHNTLESVATSVGFLSRSKFTNAFKKYKGMTPSVYIKSL